MIPDFAGTVRGRRTYAQMAITRVPHTMKASPSPDRRVRRSLNTTAEKAMDTRMLSVSMGTTTLTTPFWMA